MVIDPQVMESFTEEELVKISENVNLELSRREMDEKAK